MKRYFGLFLLFVALLTGCVQQQGPDYTAFLEYRPRSILVIPPLNESTDIKAAYSVLSTVSRPLAEMGYYMFPVAVIDQFLKENGMPTTGEMQNIPLDKIDEIVGADAVLYLTVNQYGTKYIIFDSYAVVEMTARLVDVKTGTTLWNGQVEIQRSNGGNSNDVLVKLITVAISQAVSQNTDEAHSVAHQASNCLFMSCKNKKMLYGPYHTKYMKDFEEEQ